MTRALVLGVVVLAAGCGSTVRATPPAHCQHPRGRTLVLISAKTAAVDRSFPQPDTEVLAVLADGHGGWFVAGGFTCVGTVARGAVAHLHADGTLDSSFVPALPRNPRFPSGVSTPTTLALAAGQLYVGGAFGVVALDARTGARRWRVRTHGRVLSLAAGDGTVYAGGLFDRPRKSLLALDAGTGRPRTWRQPVVQGVLGDEEPVMAVALEGGRLFVGGDDLVAVDGKPRRELAAVAAASGQLLPWRAGTIPPGASVAESILVGRGLVFTAGADGIGISSATTGKTVPWAAAKTGARFAASGSLVYLAGDCRNTFTDVDGKPRSNLAALHVPDGRLTSWAPRVARYTCVSAIAADATQVLVGGGFTATLG